MTAVDAALVGVLVLGAASLAASVGHGGASSYLAAMALVGLAPPAMRATALVLNLLVAGLAGVRFAAAHALPWRTLAPFVVGSVPFAWLGGTLALPGHVHTRILGVALGLAAAHLLAMRSTEVGSPLRRFHPAGALAVGSGIGLLSGLTGVGGGIFLSPLLVLGRFAHPREASGVSAAFIWLNSAAALAARPAALGALPPAVAVWGAAALVGGALGARYGSRRASPHALRTLLGMVLAIAALKLLVS